MTFAVALEAALEKAKAALLLLVESIRAGYDEEDERYREAKAAWQAAVADAWAIKKAYRAARRALKLPIEKED